MLDTMADHQSATQEVDLTDIPADIPEEMNDDASSMDQPSHYNPSHQHFAPPARLTARFTRSSTTFRRKSSAASSRRNSMSSTHSHSSSRSCRTGGYQSNYVAQHLRRASIIESRKARLADRAAHAERVRSRAADLAKASARASNSEERALAAQQAREKHLAQVAAACAEEVKRAKKVAEEMKERKAAEERRYRLEMEEKLAEAERRRAAYMRTVRRPRNSSVHNSDGSGSAVRKFSTSSACHSAMTECSAATIIQNRWRIVQRKRALESFVEIGLTVEMAQDSSFDALSQILSDKKVLDITTNVLKVFNLCSTDEGTSDFQTATRTFLSAYLILGHPTSVLSRDEELEQDLINKAKELMINFESAILKALGSVRYLPSVTVMESLSLAHSAYLAAFSDWKVRDSSSLIETMVASFVSLDRIWQSVKDCTEGEVAQDYREGIRENQAILLTRIRKLAGSERAKKLIKEAIRESRRSNVKRRPLGDVRPRIAIEESYGAAHGAATDAHNHHVSPANSAAASELINSSADLEADVRREPGAGEFQSSALSQIFSTIPPNRVLVHELAMNKEYRINTSPQTEIREALNRDVCEGMRRAFAEGEGDIWTVAIAENIRAKLLRLLKEGNPIHQLISETLDPDMIKTQCQQGVFSYDKFFEFMSSILPRLCAPFRDAEVNMVVSELRQPGNLDEMIEKLFKLLHTIDLLSLDYSNFLLMSAAPALIKESSGYEHRMFAQDVESGIIDLSRTRDWWQKACISLLAESDRRDPENVGGHNNRPTTQKVYARGLVDLTICSGPLLERDVPETLDLDRERITRIREDAVRITVISAILLTAKNLLRRHVRSQWRAETKRIWEILRNEGYRNMSGDSASSPSRPSSSSSSSESMSTSPSPSPSPSLATRIIQIITATHAMPASSQSILTSTVTRLLSQAVTGKFTDPVIKVLFTRLRSQVFARVSASSSGERVRRAAAAGEKLSNSGLGEFVERVEGLVNELGNIARVDWASHGQWYDEIIQNAEQNINSSPNSTPVSARESSNRPLPY